MRDAYSANRTVVGQGARGLRPAVTAMTRRFLPKLSRRPVRVASPSVTGGPAGPGRSLLPSAGGASRRAKGLARTGAGALAALLCMALLSVALPDRARAQTDTTLVSNLGQLFGGTTLVGNVADNTATQAQRFTTGGTIADSFTLSKAVINMGTQTGTLTLRVSIYSADVSDNPGSSLYVLTNPASISQTANNTFTAPVGSTLTGGTDYFIVLERTASTGGINVTTTGSLDQEGLDGWTVADERHWKLGGEAWQTSTSIIRFSLVSTPDARLSTLVLSVDGTTVPGLLSPAFDPDVTEYTASVENSVDKIGVDVTLSDATATFDMFDAGGMAIPLVDNQVSLVVGANVIDVEVTAHDGTTTKTYRVTVTRAGALPPANLRATPGSEQVALSWDAPDSGSGVIRHEYRYKPVDGDYPATWTEIPNSAVGEANEDGVTVSGLTNVTVYTFQVRAVDALGDGPSSEITAGPLPVVTIEVDNAGGDAILGVDRVDFAITRAGSTSTALAVALTLTQDQAFLPDLLLSQSVTIAEGRSSTLFRLTTNRFDASAGSGTLTATVATGTDYAVGTPSSAAIEIKAAAVPITVRIEQAAYTVDEPGTVTVNVIAEMAPGLPAPDDSLPFEFRTRDGTATAGLDYTAVSRTGLEGLAFQAGDFQSENGVWVARKAQTVTILDDTADDDGEQFTVLVNRTSRVAEAIQFVTPDKSAECPADGCTATVTITEAAVAAPANLMATPGDGQVALSWDAPASDSAVTRHEYRYKAQGGDYPSTWTQIANSGAGGANEDAVTVTGLTNGTFYTFQVRAVSDAGTGEAVRVFATPRDPALAAVDATSSVKLTVGTTFLVLSPSPGMEGSFTAAVANEVDTVTVDVFTNVADATFEILDGNDMPIRDLDLNAEHHQVGLSPGDNVIKVKVTATDGITTLTKTYTVTRAGGPALVLAPTAVHVAEGHSATYTVKLNSAPTGTVTVLLTVTGDSDVTVQPSVLSFTTSDWAAPQPVTVTAGLDGDDDTDTATIVHQPHGGGYDGLAGSVRVTVSDAEGSGVGRLQLAGNLETGEEVVNGETVPYTKGRLEIWMRGALNPDSNRWEASYGGTVLAGAAQGAWGTVCDDTFRRPDNKAAEVACRIMGYEGGEYASGYGSNMSLADKAIWLDDVRCLAGTPSHRVDDPRSLLDCNHGGRGYHNCSHREDVGLKCTGRLGTPVDSGPELRAATLVDDRQAVLLGFDEALDADNLPPTGAFRVFVVDHNDDTRLVTGLGAPAENPLQLRLDLHKPVPGGMEVKVIYDDPTSGDDGEAIQDGDGNDAHAFRVVTESGSASTAEDGPLSDEAETGLAAEFKDLPASHDGEAPFTFELALSEEIEGLSWVTVRDSVLDVTGGRVTQARRLEAPSNRRWAVTVEPGGDGEISIALPPTTDCEAEGALCTADGRMLANGRATLVPGPQAAPAPEPEADLTVRFESVPDTHDGESPVVFRLAFSEEPASDYSYKTMRDRTLNVWQGARLQVREARRVAPPSNRRWQVTVEPVSKADITVGLGPTFDCADNGAVCTGDGRRLANPLHKVIKGPPGISVADARVDEAADATVDFAVSLSRAASETVTVDYATADGTATAGSDYTATSGALTFAPGDTAKTVSVPVLDDAIDEDHETFTLTLSNPSGGNAWLSDAEATGTIENSDPMPQAWLARFGRTIASQAVDAIGGRMEGGGGTHVTVGGQSLSLTGGPMTPEDEEDVRGALEALSLSDEPADETRSMTGRELLLGSSFQLSAGGEAGGSAFTAWGQFTTGGFEADVDGTRMDGRVTTGFLGADVGAADWLAGLALGVSEGEGDYTLMEGGDSGTVESALTAVYPYARLGLSETVDVWGLVGYGTGELTLTQNPDTDRAKTYRTDIGMRMVAVGARGEVISPEEPDGLTVALKSDAFWVRTTSEAVRRSDGNLGASEADVNRVRLLVEGSRSFATGDGTLTPTLELGVRNDGGDAETGTGIEAGAGLRYSGGGVTVEGSVRTLVAHEESGYEEWGASGAVRIDPGESGRGLSLTLSPVWGNASSGVDRLWSLADAQGLAGESAFEATHRLEAEAGYGLGGPDGLGTVTPYTGLALSDTGERTWRLGARWQVAPSISLNLEGTRGEPANDDGPVHGLMLRGVLRL